MTWPQFTNSQHEHQQITVDLFPSAKLLFTNPQQLLNSTRSIKLLNIQQLLNILSLLTLIYKIKAVTLIKVFFLLSGSENNTAHMHNLSLNVSC